MSHALIIEDNMIVGHAIEQHLVQAGFRSFDHAWTERQAMDFAQRHRPDLVVIGDGLEQGSTMDIARNIGDNGSVLVLMATTDPFRIKDSFPPELAIHGPCRLDEIGRLLEEGLIRGAAKSMALS